MNVILSIKPQFADAIFAGKKTVEFRKKRFKKQVDNVLVYRFIAPAPGRALFLPQIDTDRHGSTRNDTEEKKGALAEAENSQESQRNEGLSGILSSAMGVAFVFLFR